MKTPYFYLDLGKFRDNCEEVMESFIDEWGENVIFGYSVKTNHYRDLIVYANRELGWYIECVSPYEVKCCIDFGIDIDNIIYNGPNKENTLSQFVNCNTYINFDNIDEVEKFCNCKSTNKNVGIRINFDLEKLCPNETTAGESVSRFGIDSESKDLEYAIELLKNNGLNRVGLHMHTSTKTRSIEVFKHIAQKVVEIKKKNDLELSFVDVGGGFFGGQKVDDKPTMKQYGKTICNILKDEINPKETTLILEPGASVLATCGYYFTKVVNVKEIRNTRVITLDGTVLHINPFIAKRNQVFEIKKCDGEEKRIKVDKQILCGSTCMENDRFGELDYYEEIKKNDILIFKNVGAYTMAFNSEFILEKPKIMVDPFGEEEVLK